MKTYTGVIESATAHTVSIRVAAGGVHQYPTLIEIHASGAIAAEAAGMIGRKVTFAVDFSERTESLLSVQLCVRSSYGLRAVVEDTRSSGVRVAPDLSNFTNAELRGT